MTLNVPPAQTIRYKFLIDGKWRVDASVDAKHGLTADGRTHEVGPEAVKSAAAGMKETVTMVEDVFEELNEESFFIDRLEKDDNLKPACRQKSKGNRRRMSQALDDGASVRKRHTQHCEPLNDSEPPRPAARPGLSINSNFYFTFGNTFTTLIFK